MKKYFLLIFIMLFSYAAFAQRDISGKYHNYFGSNLTLHSDSSFKFLYHFDLSSSWSIGKWTILNDTVFLHNVPIFDTLLISDTTWISRASKIYSVKESNKLILSTDENPNRISTVESAINEISGGGQNRVACPLKLYYRKGRLYEINENGKIETKKVKGFSTKKKFSTYYVNQ